MKPPVLLLDRSYFPISVIPWRRAVSLLLRDAAETLKWAPEQVGQFDVSVVRLVNRSIPPDHRKQHRITKRHIFERDGWQCGYCGRAGNKGLTIDHVIPKSRGGTNHPTNLVAACHGCNNWKGSSLLEEAGMRLLYQPKLTSIGSVPGLHQNQEEWREFLGIYKDRYPEAA